jgi:hypothetical protein
MDLGPVNWYTFLCASDVGFFGSRTVGALNPMAVSVTDDHASCLTPVFSELDHSE